MLRNSVQLFWLCDYTKEGGDTMSAVARDYAYQVKIEKGSEKPAPTISLEVLKKYQADVAKYLKRENDKQR